MPGQLQPQPQQMVQQQQAPQPSQPPQASGGNSQGVNVTEVWVLDTRIAKLGGLDYPMGGNQAFYGLCRIAQALAGQSLRLQDFKTSETRAPKACPFAAGPFYARGLWHSETQPLAVYQMFMDAKLQPDRLPQDPYNGKVGDTFPHFIQPAATFLGKKWDNSYMPSLRQQIWAPEATVYSSELLVTVPRKHEDLSVCIHRVPLIPGRTEDQMYEDEKKRHAEVCLGKPYTIGERPEPDNSDRLWEQVAHDQGQYKRADIPNEIWWSRHPEWQRCRPPIVLSMAQASRLASDEQKNYKLLEAQKLDPNAQRQWGTMLHGRIQKLYNEYKSNGWAVGGFAFRNEWTLQELIKVCVAPPIIRPQHGAQLPPCFAPDAQRVGLLLRSCMELMCNQAKRGKGRQGGLVLRVANETVQRVVTSMQWPTIQASKQDGGKWLFIDEDPTMEHNAWVFLAQVAGLVGTVPEALIQCVEPKTDAVTANMFNGLVQACQFRVNVGKDDVIAVHSLSSAAPNNVMQSLEARFGPASAAAPQ